MNEYCLKMVFKIPLLNNNDNQGIRKLGYKHLRHNPISSIKKSLT